MAKQYVVVKHYEPTKNDKYHSLTHDSDYETIATEQNTGVAMGVVPLEEDEVELVRNLPQVKEVYEDQPISYPKPTTEAGAQEMASFKFINLPQVWEKGYKGKGVKVAVLDTGLDSQHAEGMFSGRVSAGADFTGKGNWHDGDGHGTHVAGTVLGPDNWGVAPEATLMVGKVLADNGGGQWSWCIQGIEWAVNNGAQVVNLSLSGYGASNSPIAMAVNAANDKGILVFCAAGNDGCRYNTSEENTPSNAAGAVTVAAVDNEGGIASFSSCGTNVDIAFPGVNISSLGLNGTTGKIMSGTSMATPHGAGAAAVLLSTNKGAAEVKQALYGSARDTGLAATKEGQGIADVYGAYQKLGLESVQIPEYSMWRFYNEEGSTDHDCRLYRKQDGTRKYLGVFRKS